MAIIQVQTTEQLVWAVAQPRAQEALGGGRTIQSRPARMAFFVMTPREFERGVQAEKPTTPKPVRARHRRCTESAEIRPRSEHVGRAADAR